MTVQFRPIDSAARDGNSRLVRDDRGHPHAAKWIDGRWCYGSGTAVAGNVVEYAVNERAGI